MLCTQLLVDIRDNQSLFSHCTEEVVGGGWGDREKGDLTERRISTNSLSASGATSIYRTEVMERRTVDKDKEF